MPFLVPAPDFSKHQLENHKLLGTCDTQICRSVSPWSIGTPKITEHSIQNAYIKAIQMSQHFVYIGRKIFNQNFVLTFKLYINMTFLNRKPVLLHIYCC